MTPLSNKSGFEIAVSGYACKLPQANDPDAFWQVLDDRRCVITSVKEDRWAESRYLNVDQSATGRMYTMAAGQLDDIWGFDPGFFAISPREASICCQPRGHVHSVTTIRLRPVPSELT
ncbi:MAG: beta-ketoacyl synthase N-terminal-like domain-containing protein, partial [Pseudomonadota bacterium]